MSFLDVCCSPPFQKRGIVFPVHVNAIIQEVDVQKSFSVPEHCHHHLAGWLHNFLFLGDRGAGWFHWCDSLLLSGTKWGTRVSSWGENRASKSSGADQNTTRRLRINLPLFWIWHLGIRLQVHTEHIDMPKDNYFGGCIIYLHFRCDVSDRHWSSFITRWPTSSTFSSDTAAGGRPLWMSSSMLCRPALKSSILALTLL